MAPPDLLSIKDSLVQELFRRLNREYETLRAAQKATHEGATHEEAKPENDKDTRALEQSYLARGQAERVETLRQDVLTIQALRPRTFSAESPAALTALVTLEEEDGQQRLVLLVPAGAGETLPSPLGEVKTITPQSPLGRAVLGRCEGDEIEWNGPSGKRTLLLTVVR